LQVQSIFSLLAAGESEFGEQVSQTVGLLAPTAGENLPLTQAIQGELPVSDLYLPATHWAHVVSVEAVEPALQMQSVCSLLAASELEFAVHD